MTDIDRSPRRVPYLDLGAAYRELQDALEPAILALLRSGRYIGGEEVGGFERDFAAYVGAGHCVGVGNGLDALRLALLAMGAGPGDEVIVPSNTCIATWLAVSHCGATPVPVDPRPGSYVVDARDVEAAIGPRTRVILPVHLYGFTADTGAMMEVAARHGVLVLDDAAQAHGARVRGARVGAMAHATAWSFYPSKNLGALGDAGAVTTDDAALAETVRLLGNYGSRIRNVHECVGANSRLDPVQAAVLRVKLRHLDEWNERRLRVAAAYAAGLAGSGLELPAVPAWCDPIWHIYPVRHAERDRLREELAAAGVETLVHYPVPPHLQGAYASLGYGAGSFPVAEDQAATIFSLPMGPQLPLESAEEVVRALRRSLG